MVQVDYVVLADGAQAVGGKHYILGGGWDTLYALAYPVVHPTIAVALRLAVSWADTNQPFALELDLLDDNCRSILPDPPGALRGTINIGRPVHLSPGASQHPVFVLDVANVRFDRPGTYLVVLRINGTEASRTAFSVALPPGAVAL